MSFTGALHDWLLSSASPNCLSDCGLLPDCGSTWRVPLGEFDDFDIYFLGIGTAPCDIGAVDLVLVCVRLFTTKNGDRLLVCIVCLMDERSLSGFGALYPVLRRRFFSRIRGMEDITNGGLFLTSLALVNWIFVLCSILLWSLAGAYCVLRLNRALIHLFW